MAIVSHATPPTGADVAVVGMAVRAPGAATLDEFWNNLSRGVESIRRFSPAELAASGESPERLSHPDYVNAHPVLDRIDQFDASFFGLSPQDAAITDPQHRVFLEVGWEALEHAGYAPSRITGQVGVFATSGMNSYMTQHLFTNPRIMRTVGEWLVRHTGNDPSFLATSLSYHLDLKGPSLNVQCACSSALVAIHLAVQSLLGGECEMALAGGSVVVLPQDRGYLHQAGEILARDGHCRPFDAQATGTLFGSGAGVVVLRRLADALADGDNVLAVVRGSAVNNDGAMKAGFLAPSVEGQSRVISEALAVSGVDAGSISYVEAHGTGTIVGDPIEVTALTEAFRRQTDKRGFCRIGSLKSNIGHLGEAAGVLGFIKTVLSLQHRQLPATLNYASPNPGVDFAASPFVVNDTLSDWTSDGAPRRAGVTALGAGGTNCHVILEEAPPSREPIVFAGEQVLTLSARTPAALLAMRANLAAALARGDAPNLADVAFTLRTGRETYDYRWSASCATHAEAVSALRDGGATDHARRGASPAPVVFLFPGGGAQYPDMGRGLYEEHPVYGEALDQCLSIVRDRLGVDLRAALFPSPATRADAARVLARPTQSMMSVFVVEYALARLWTSWGVRPAAMSGHSLGEYVAACLAGVFSLEDALAIVKARGDIFRQLPPGSMLSVLLPEDQLAPYLSGRLAIAAVNARSTAVVSGPVDEIEALAMRLDRADVDTQPLNIAVAAHSPMLDPYLDEFRRAVTSVRLSPPAVPVVSNLTGQWLSAEEATDPDYWVRHLRGTVRFNDGLNAVLADPDQILLEVGPGRTLTSLARQHPARPLGVVASLRHASEELRDARTVGTALGRLWALGASLDWSAVDGARRRRVPLPTYPFERQRHWIDAGVPVAVDARAAAPPRAARSDDVAEWFYVPEWVATPAPEPGVLNGDVLVFADGDADVARSAVAGIAKAPGTRVYVVESGQGFARLGDDRFAVNAAQPDDYVALFDALGASADALGHIVYGWTLPADAATADHVESQLDRHFYGPLALARALGQRDLEQPIAITFLTQGVAQVAGEAAVAPLGATVCGPCRVLPRECPNLSTRIVDIVVPAFARQRASLSRLLAAELASAPTSTLVAYRTQTRWVESFAHRRLAAAGPTTLREEGVYVITGGLGELGLALAAHLAQAYRARLVLIGRTALPPRPEWAGWLATHGPDDRTSVRIRRVQECETSGARVMVESTDVADVAQLADLRQDVLATFGGVHGVFHAAGTLDDGAMQLKTRASAGAVLRPKVHGTLALQEVFGRDPLDFIVLFSSVSAVFGLQGQVDYTAANAFLDTFADANASGAVRVVSIGWGPWRDGGLALAAARHRRGGAARPSSHPWLGHVLQAATGDITVSLELDRGRHWMVGEHVLQTGEAVLPGTGYLELARAALAEVMPTATVEVSDLLFQAPLIVPREGPAAVDLVLSPSGAAFDCTWRAGEDVYATARIASTAAVAGPPLNLAAIRARCTARVDTPAGFLDQPFMHFGPRWANVQTVRYGAQEALIELALPREFADDTRQTHLHPALLDMATGGAQALIPDFDQARDFFVPLFYERVRVFGALPATVCSYVRLQPATHRDLAVFDVTVTDSAGTVLVDVSGFCMKRLAAALTVAPRPQVAPAARGAAAPVQTPAGVLADELLAQGMSAGEFLDALNRIMRTGVAHTRVVVMPAELSVWQAKVDVAFQRLAPNPVRSGRAGNGLPAATGRSGIEDELVALWQDLLGVTDVAPTDNFFDLGGHSLIAVRLLNRIEKRFATRLPLATMFDATTIADLARLIQTEANADAAGGAPLLSAAGGEPARSPAASRAAKLLVFVQRGNGQTPLFVVHGAGGNVLNFRDLARAMSPLQAVYGIQAAGVDGVSPAHTSIDAMVDAYLAEVTATQDHGPYLLAGYSGGGIVALEMARRLTASGERVGLLGLIDTFHPDMVLNRPSLLSRLGRLRREGIGYLGGVVERKRTRTARAKGIRVIEAHLAAGEPVPFDLRELHMIENFSRAVRGYRPIAWQGRATLYRAEEVHQIHEDAGPAYGWDREIVGGVTIVPVAGNHDTLLLGANAQRIARSLSMLIEEATREPT